MAYNKYSIVIIYVLLAMLAQFCGCGEEIHLNLPQYSGTIVMLGANNVYYHIQSGQVDELELIDKYYHPAILCRGPNNSYLVAANKVYSKEYMEEADSRVQYCSNIVHFYYPSENSFEIIECFTYGDCHTYSLDYNKNNATYLYCGYYHDQKGIWLLDSSFNIMEDYTFMIEDQKYKIAKGWFLNDNSILVKNGDMEIFKYNTLNRTRTNIGSGCVCAVSRDRNFVLIADACSSDDYKKLYLHNIQEKTVQEVKPGRLAGLSCTFSPDNKEIAYFTSFGLLDDALRLNIYDIEKKESYAVDLTGRRSLAGSGLDWIE